ncbi:hypothetical protein [Paraburkholderia sp.]
MAFYILAVVPFMPFMPFMPFVAALAVFFLGIETKDKVLEQLEA